MKKSKIGIIGILFILLAVVAVSGCLGEESGDGFTVNKATSESGDGYLYTFDSGNTLTIGVVNQDVIDSISYMGTAKSEYGSGVYYYSSSLWFEPTPGKIASVIDYESCTTDEIKKAIADVKNKA